MYAATCDLEGPSLLPECFEPQPCDVKKERACRVTPGSNSFISLFPCCVNILCAEKNLAPVNENHGAAVGIVPSIQS